MSTVLFIALVVVAAAACPLHLWWQQRRGAQAGCCASPVREQATNVEALHARQRDLAARIAEFDLTVPDDAAGREVTRG